jgi:2-amino-4-hydroxy-6-hydroxymethyldihydropteridine diphosphokinase
MPELFVGAGSNVGPERALRCALLELEKRFGPVRCSSVYRSAAIGVPAADYLNVVMALSTEAQVDEVREALRAVEALAGRDRRDPTVCALDLDLLLYGLKVDARRRLPRPGLFVAPFVLVPLAELAPELVHPVTGQGCRAAAAAVDASLLENRGALLALR